MIRILPLLRIPFHENMADVDNNEFATISSDNILHDLTIFHQGSSYNVLMEDVASIINIPETLRHVKVFHQQGEKHLRVTKDQKNGKVMKGKVMKSVKKTHTQKKDDRGQLNHNKILENREKSKPTRTKQKQLQTTKQKTEMKKDMQKKRK